MKNILILTLFLAFGIIELNAEFEFSEQERRILSQIDDLFLKLSSNPDSSINEIKRIEIKCNKMKFNLGIAHCNRFYGKHLQFTGDFPDALKSLHLALSQIKQFGYDKDLALIKRDLGEYYRAVNNLEESAKSLRTAEEIFARLKDSINLARTYNRLAATFHENSEKQKAINYAFKSISLIDKQKYFALHSNNYTIIGANQTIADSIEYYYLKAKVLAEFDNSKIELITIYANLSLHYQRNGNLIKGEEYGLKSYKISVDNTFKGGIARAARILSGVYADMYDYKNAYYYSNIAYNYRERIMNEKKLQEVIDLKMQKEMALRELQFAEEKKSYVFAIVFIIVGLIISAAFLIVIVNKNRKLKLTSDELKEKNDLITIKNSDLVHLNATKDKFFSIIAHDLRNPVNAFGMASEYIKHELHNLDKNHLNELLTELSNNSTHLSLLLENLLEWSKTQRNAIVLHRTNFQLIYIVDAILGVMKTSASNKRIKLETNIDKTFIIYGDTNIIDAILRNIISNAIKYCTEGGKISIYASKVIVDNLIFSEIKVIDTGIGMDDKTINSLFNIETNKSNPGTKGETGTGLGLILCKEFVDLHNGNIKVESKLGAGSTFILQFPDENK